VQADRRQRAVETLALARGRQGERDAVDLKPAGRPDRIAECNESVVEARKQELRVIAPDEVPRGEPRVSGEPGVRIIEAEAMSSSHARVAHVVAVNGEHAPPSDV